jgi:serine/threonine-protein kinase HipA
MNPNPEKYEHTLAIAPNDARPSIATLLGAATRYRLSSTEAKRVVDEVTSVVGTWKTRAAQLKIPRTEIQMMVGAFFSNAQQ